MFSSSSSMTVDDHKEPSATFGAFDRLTIQPFIATSTTTQSQPQTSVSCLATSTVTTSSTQSDQNIAKVAYETLGFEELRKKAFDNDPQANFALACRYEKGLGVTKDLPCAIIYFKEAAKSNVATASEKLLDAYLENDIEKATLCYFRAEIQGEAAEQCKMGQLYENGIGVKKDLKAAVSFYQLAADKKLARAQTNLARCYATGTGVEKDLAKAIGLYRSAAEQGNTEAQVHLGMHYEKGIGVAQSLDEAVRLYTAAANSKDLLGQENLDRLFRIGFMAGDIENTVKLIQLAASLNSGAARFYLAFCYETGTGVEQSPISASEEYKQAEKSWPRIDMCKFDFLYTYANGQQRIDETSPLGQYLLGVRYRYGFGIEQDLDKAIELCTIAAKRGCLAAPLSLACFYLGRSKMENKQEYLIQAQKWLEEAANQKSSCAQQMLAVMYDGMVPGHEKLFPIQQNFNKAASLYKEAAAKGNSVAQIRLALFYIFGIGVEKNPEAAFKLLKQGAEQGNKDGKFYLSLCYANSIAVAQDLKEATKLLRGLINERCVLNSFLKGFSDLAKISNQENLIKFTELFTPLAEQGDCDAQVILGYCSFYGIMVKESLEAADKWFTQAAQKGDDGAKNLIKELTEQPIKAMCENIDRVLGRSEKIERLSTSTVLSESGKSNKSRKSLQQKKEWPKTLERYRWKVLSKMATTNDCIPFIFDHILSFGLPEKECLRVEWNHLISFGLWQQVGLNSVFSDESQVYPFSPRIWKLPLPPSEMKASPKDARSSWLHAAEKTDLELESRTAEDQKWLDQYGPSIVKEEFERSQTLKQVPLEKYGKVKFVDFSLMNFSRKELIQRINAATDALFLNLKNCKVDDESLMQMNLSNEIKFLNLSYNPITDASIPILKKLAGKLENLCLNDTAIKKESIAALQEENPNLEIYSE